MAKGQKRSNREQKKPKGGKKPVAAVSSFLKQPETPAAKPGRK